MRSSMVTELVNGGGKYEGYELGSVVGELVDR